MQSKHQVGTALFTLVLLAAPVRAQEAAPVPSPGAPVDLPVVVLSRDAAPVAISAPVSAIIEAEAAVVDSLHPVAATEQKLGAKVDEPEAAPATCAATADLDFQALPPDDTEDAAAEEAGDGEDAEAEADGATDGAVNGNEFRYTADLSDDELQKEWSEDRAALGTISVGFTDAGRLINAKQFPSDGPWTLVCGDKAWATQETIDYLTKVLTYMDEKYPDGSPMRVNGISAREGGYVRPHRSHQSGRDVDLGFYLRDVAPTKRAHTKEQMMDVGRNWALVKALVTMSDVQVILVDKRIQKTLVNYALAHGENKAWVDSVFHTGANALVKHARRHRDHFHVRFYNPRAQELGRRVQPLLAKDPNAKHVVVHRVRGGDTLGHIARKYGTTVAAIKSANGLRSNALRAGHSLAIPMRGPCTNCPMPPPLVVPPRRLPPEAVPDTVASARIGVRALSAP